MLAMVRNRMSFQEGRNSNLKSGHASLDVVFALFRKCKVEHAITEEGHDKQSDSGQNCT